MNNITKIKVMNHQQGKAARHKVSNEDVGTYETHSQIPSAYVKDEIESIKNTG